MKSDFVSIVRTLVEQNGRPATLDDIEKSYGKPISPHKLGNYLANPEIVKLGQCYSVIGANVGHFVIEDRIISTVGKDELCSGDLSPLKAMGYDVRLTTPHLDGGDIGLVQDVVYRGVLDSNIKSIIQAHVEQVRMSDGRKGNSSFSDAGR